jgi:hypothetical protein
VGTKRQFHNEDFQSQGGILLPSRIALPSAVDSSALANEGDVGYASTADRLRFRNAANDFLVGPLAYLRTSDTASISTGTNASMTVTIPWAGTWIVDINQGILGNGTTATPGFRFTGTATTSAWRQIIHTNWQAITTGDPFSNGTTLSGTVLNFEPTGTAVVTREMYVRAFLTVTAGGTLNAEFNRPAGSGTYQLIQNARMIVAQVG